MRWKNRPLSCYFCERTCKFDYSYSINKSYGNFNNIMSVMGATARGIGGPDLPKIWTDPQLFT